MAVLPSADNATEVPWLTEGPATAPVPTSFGPCWVQSPLVLRVKTHVAPSPSFSNGPPTMAVLPLLDRATDQPCLASPAAPPPTSFDPCWVHCAKACCGEKNRAASATNRSLCPN